MIRFEIYVADALNWFSRLEQCFTCRKPLQGMFNDLLLNVNPLNISSVTCLEKEMNDFEKNPLKTTFEAFRQRFRNTRIFSDLSRVTFENNNSNNDNNSINNHVL